MYSLRRKLLSQNFLHDPNLVEALVGSSSIGKHDLVLEIGPGKGIITQSLLKRAGQVVAIELDFQWYQYVQRRYASSGKLILYHGDFLTHPLPKFPYKVFANIPFAIEGKVVRRLLEADNPPADCSLVVMAEFGKRLATPAQSRLFSSLHQPWFEFSIEHHFSPADFEPRPSVEAVLWRSVKRHTPLLPWSERAAYQRLVRTGFGSAQTLRQNLHKKYPLSIINAALHQLSLSRKSKPGHLTSQHWVALYNYIVKTYDHRQLPRLSKTRHSRRQNHRRSRFSRSPKTSLSANHQFRP